MALDKPFTHSHCVRMYQVTYQILNVLNAFFCSLLCVHIYDTAESCIAGFVFFLKWEVCRERVCCRTN